MGCDEETVDHQEPNLEDYPSSTDDPGTPLADGEEWYFWRVGDLQGRFRVRNVNGVVERVYPKRNIE